LEESQIFIVGANGQLGKALKTLYPGAQSADIDQLDITNKESVESYDWSNIKLILNAAAYTNVDSAETPEGRVAAWNVNAAALSYLSEVARNHDITFVHVSTDYVFDGSSITHTETEHFSPLNVYGASKAAGDLVVFTIPKHYILRTSWVIGEGNNFVRTMLGLGNKGINPTVVSDQIGRLTFTSELVRVITHLLSSKCPYGTYNVSNDGESKSWADITREIFHLAGLSNTVTDTTTADYYSGKEGIAPRPLNSTLDLGKIKATGFTPIDWNIELKNYIEKESKV
jgi:dTDP-4-dehydrorhamnose 3,5-epimerase/reductase